MERDQYGRTVAKRFDLNSVEDLRGLENQVSYGEPMRVRVIRGNEVETYDVRI